MKILFLDIDGVINTSECIISYEVNRQYDKSYITSDKYGSFFDEKCVRYLNWIVNVTGCKIVVSSTWKRGGLKYILKLWKDRKLPGEIIDITPMIVDQYVINMYGVVNDGADRGFEIQQWLEENKCDNYCIVDDDSDMLSHQMKNFVKTDPMVGITISKAEEIIEILNAETPKIK